MGSQGVRHDRATEHPEYNRFVNQCIKKKKKFLLLRTERYFGHMSL